MNVLVFICLVVMISACHGRANLVEFCEVGSASSERIFFDPDQRVAFASDTSSSLAPIYTGPYYGFTMPIPMMVPTQQAMREQSSVEWEADGYRFVATTASDTADWVLVHAEPVGDPPISAVVAVRTSTAVLYSWESGVIAYNRVTEVEGDVFRSENYLCSARSIADGWIEPTRPFVRKWRPAGHGPKRSFT